MCPYIAGSWPRDELPSSIENNGLILDLHSNFGALGYGMDAFDAQDPLAWPLFATEEDVQGFPPAVISVNECDPLRDEGVEFYRLLLRAGQTARCRQVMGTTHGGDNQVLPCPDLARARPRSTSPPSPAATRADQTWEHPISKITDDPRIDPRIKAFFGDFTSSPSNVANREELLARANSPAAAAATARMEALWDQYDMEAIAPSHGFTERTVTFSSQPDGNEIPILLIRPEGDEALPCVYAIHGGGMSAGTCFDDRARAWARLLARHGVAVAAVEFRNSIVPSVTTEVAPYPAGLNDCVSGLRWIADHADELGVDTSRIVVAGASGGGNLTLALGLRLNREGDTDLVSGLYALCPYIAGSWPRDDLPSSIENNGTPPRPPQQQRRDELRHRRVRGPEPARLGPASPAKRTSAASRPPSSPSTSATLSATRASSSTASCSAPASQRAAAR